jgi:hypothetical protein
MNCSMLPSIQCSVILVVVFFDVSFVKNLIRLSFFCFSRLLAKIQVLSGRVWFCKPLTVDEFSGAIERNCLKPHMSFLGISHQHGCYF